MPARRRSALSRLALAALVLAPLALGVGCAVHATYPERPEENWSQSDPNVHPSPRVMLVALRHVVDRFPVEGPYVVNLPQGMEKRWAEDLLRRLDDPNANLVTRGTADLPAYHITSVWVRPGARAYVDILRPVRGVGTPEAPLFQRITVRLREAPLRPWSVESARVWPMGLDTPPALFGWPDLEGLSTRPVPIEPAAEPGDNGAE